MVQAKVAKNGVRQERQRKATDTGLCSACEGFFFKIKQL